MLPPCGRRAGFSGDSKVPQRRGVGGALGPRHLPASTPRLRTVPGSPMLTDASLTFLTALLDAPGPSGVEAAPARLWRAEGEGFADEVRADVNGNSLASLHAGAAGAAPLMFAGHVDEIGIMVVHIDD